MIAATVKFALETKRLAEEQNGKDAEESDSNVDRTDGEEENSDNEEEDLTEQLNRWWYALPDYPNRCNLALFVEHADALTLDTRQHTYHPERVHLQTKNRLLVVAEGRLWGVWGGGLLEGSK